MGKQDKQDRLDELAIRWLHTAEEDKAVKENLRMQIWALVFEIAPNYLSEAPADTIPKMLDSFDENKGDGKFSHRLNVAIKYQPQEAERQKAKQMARECSCDDEENPIEPLQAHTTDALAQLEAQDTVMEITTMILNLRGTLKNTETRWWYGLFYTETMTRSAKTAPQLLRHRERDIFHAMDLPYLDYYMQKQCQDVDAIANTPLKTEREIIDSEFTTKTELPDTEVKLNWSDSKSPLPAAVPLSFLKRERGINSGNPTHSRYFHKYQSMIEQYRP